MRVVSLRQREELIPSLPQKSWYIYSISPSASHLNVNLDKYGVVKSVWEGKHAHSS
jgi:hypothetical protein